jgi:hypothetical protein
VADYRTINENRTADIKQDIKIFSLGKKIK